MSYHSKRLRKHEEYQNIPLNLIDPCSLNPRIDKESGIDDMSQSIDRIGILHDPVIRPMGPRYEVVVGDIRINTFRKRGDSYVMCKVRDMTDLEVEIAIAIENGIRRSLTDVEMGRLIVSHMKRFKDQTGKKLTHTKISKLFSCSIRRIGLWVQAEKLVDEAVPYVAKPQIGKKTPKGKISGRVASEIAILPRTIQPEITKQVAEKNLSRRQTDKVLTKIKKEIIPKSSIKRKRLPSPPIVKRIVEDAINEVIKKPKVIVDLPTIIENRGCMVLAIYYPEKDLKKVHHILKEAMTIINKEIGEIIMPYNGRPGRIDDLIKELVTRNDVHD